MADIDRGIAAVDAAAFGASQASLRSRRCSGFSRICLLARPPGAALRPLAAWWCSGADLWASDGTR